MTRAGRHRAIGAAVVLTVALAAWWIVRGAGDRGGGALAWPTASAGRYAFRLRSEIAVDGEKGIAMTISGTLALEPVTSGGATRLLGAKLEGAFDTLEGGMVSGAGDAIRQALSAALQRSFVLEYGGGRFVSARFAADTPALVKQIWKTTAEALQFVRPAGRRPSWQSEEQDSAGRYVAAYERKSRTSIHKRKLRYLPAAKPDPRTEVIASQVEIGTEGGERLRSLHFMETTRLVSSMLPPWTSDLEITLEPAREEAPRTAPADWRALLAAPRVAVGDFVGNDPDVQRQLDAARVGGAKFEDLLPRLLAARQKGGATAQDEGGRAYVALAALLRTDESKLELVRRHILEKGPLSEVLIDALRDAGSAKAQQMLAALTTAPELDPPRRAQAARGLSQVAEPTKETTEALVRLEGDPRLYVQASYGIGSNVYRLKDKHPQRAREALAHLFQQLDKARTEEVRERYLIALGNTGHPEALPVLARALDDGSARIRAAAANGLRRIEGAEAEALLARAAKDPAAEVRFAVIDAIFERGFSPLLEPAVAGLMAREPDYKTRARAVQTAGGWWLQKPGTLRESLQLVATRDEKEDLRELARSILVRAPGK